MKSRSTLAALWFVSLALAVGCDGAPGRPGATTENVAPEQIRDFKTLYRANCAGCHGLDGRGGAALALSNSVYLALANDGVIRRVTANGIPGTAMPAFARGSGGMLSDDQIDAIVDGIRRRWSDPRAVTGAELPAYGDSAPGDSRRGGDVFATFCASCHGAGGRGGRASSVVEAHFLALVSDQGLRTTVIAGRPELGAPDWRGNVPGRPMTSREIADVVAWLSAQRAPSPGSTDGWMDPRDRRARSSP